MARREGEETRRERRGGEAPCKLTGTDGNVFAVIGNVRKALKVAGHDARAREFVHRAFAAGSYDAVLRLCFEYVEVR